MVKQASTTNFVVYRLSQMEPISNSLGPTYLIPIQIWSGVPTVSGKILTPGEITYITHPVDVSPSLDFLSITV